MALYTLYLISDRSVFFSFLKSLVFFRSHCDCDAKFRRCLQNVNTETANTIGAIFFNIVQVICFKERSPCSQWQRYWFNLQSFAFILVLFLLIIYFSLNKNVESNEVSNSVTEDDLLISTRTPECELVFKQSGRYVGSQVRSFEWDQKPEFIFNVFLRKLRLLRK